MIEIIMNREFEGICWKAVVAYMNEIFHISAICN
jgi:hypothetical protein